MKTFKYSLPIILIILLPLFCFGYVMTFDMAWGPVYHSGSITSNTWIVFKVINFLNTLLAAWITQKIVLILIIALTFCGVYKLISDLSLYENKVIIYVTSLIYIFNPFFYTHLVTGQWLVLVGYALLPWALKSIYSFLKNPKLKTMWPVAIWTTAIGLTSIHTIGIIVVASIALIIYFGKHLWKTKLKYAALITIIWIGLNAIWFIPFIAGQSSASHAVQNFSHSEMEAFSTKGTVAGSVPLSAALLTGFWADDQNRYILPSHLPIWWLGVAIIMSLAVTGIILSFRRHEKLGITFFWLAVIAWLLGMGIAWPPSAALTHLLVNIIPVYNGYREPGKWLMLLALCYVYFASVGALRLYEYVVNKWPSDYARYSLVLILLIAPFLFAPTLAWGAAGQLRSADYPRGWYDARNYLNTVDTATHTKVSDTNVLVLPWHMYLPIKFTGRVVANPAPYFFDQHMITGDNFELAGVPPQNQTSTTQYVSNVLLPNSANHVNVGSQLQKYNIRYVLLLKEADWSDYSWLTSSSDLTRVLDNQNLSLYKITVSSN